MLSVYHVTIASRNISDWWLSYWISHSQGGHPSNTTPPLNSSTMANITAASDNLAFYLGIYGGLAGANSVSYAPRTCTVGGKRFELSLAFPSYKTINNWPG